MNILKDKLSRFFLNGYNNLLGLEYCLHNKAIIMTSVDSSIKILQEGYNGLECL